MPDPRYTPNDEGPLASVGKMARQVADALRAAGPSTRAQLGRTTHLSRPSVTSALAELVDLGLVEPCDDTARSGRAGGRPAELVRLTRAAGLAVGVDIGRRHIEVVVADLGHQQVGIAELRIPDNADQHPDHVLDLAADLVRTVLEEADAKLEEVRGVGVGIPAPMTRAGRLGSRTFLPAWTDVDAASEMRRRLGGVPVDVDNDGSLGALGEYVFGAGRDSTWLTYVKAATGIGAGMVLRGRLYRGAAGTAAELGHVTIDINGPLCSCGNRGCVEIYAGGGALLRQARSAGERLSTIEDLVARALDGDPLCRRLISEAGDHLGAALGTLLNLYSPDRIVIGGQLGDAGEILLAPVRDRLRRTAIGAAVDAVRVVSAELGSRASAWGCVALVLKSADPAIARR